MDLSRQANYVYYPMLKGKYLPYYHLTPAKIGGKLMLDLLEETLVALKRTEAIAKAGRPATLRSATIKRQYRENAKVIKRGVKEIRKERNEKCLTG